MWNTAVRGWSLYIRREVVSVERWSCSRGASCVVEYIIGRLRDWSV